ncbi:MAG: IS5 family transposase, partial [Candidatus Azotimanducaceae bacterium]
MRETRIAQKSVFDNYSKHDIGVQLSRLADILDSHVDILLLVEADLVKKSCKPVGRSGL